MALTGKLSVGIDLLRTTSPDVGSSSYNLAATWMKNITDGTGLNQANKVIVDSVTLAGSGSQNYDLDAGTISDPSGVASGVVAALSRVYAILIRRTDTPAASTQDENVTIGGDFILTKLLAGWTDDTITIPIRPGGIFVYIAPDATGVAVTASTGDVITLTNASSADSCTLQVVIIGS
jgi:hypothetical protein